MKKEDLYCYLKIFGVLMMISPLVVAFWSLDFGITKALYITIVQYVVITFIAICMFNYLEYGQFKPIVKR